MFITLPQDEARVRLYAAGYRLIEVMNETCEVWRTASGVQVNLNPEQDGTGCYEEEMIKLAEAQTR